MSEMSRFNSQRRRIPKGVRTFGIHLYAVSAYDKRRFLGKVDVGESDDCWPWMAVTGKNGRGRFHIQGNMRPAIRVAWAMEHNGCSAFIDIRQNCDTPACVNPAHLYNASSGIPELITLPAVKTQWPEVDTFANLMRRKLDSNRDKGGWDQYDPAFLLLKAEEEFHELREAILNQMTSEQIWDEAADVANYVMMIWSVLRIREEAARARTENDARGA